MKSIIDKLARCIAAVIHYVCMLCVTLYARESLYAATNIRAPDFIHTSINVTCDYDSYVPLSRILNICKPNKHVSMTNMYVVPDLIGFDSVMVVSSFRRIHKYHSCEIIYATGIRIVNDYQAQIQSDSRIQYASYYGGSAGDGGGTIARDAGNNIYICGITSSSDLTNLRREIQKGKRGYDDCYLSKYSDNGRRHEYSLYLGGSAGQNINSSVIDSQGNIIVAGYTTSSDFPVTAGAFQTRYGGGDIDGFIAKIDSSGTQLLFSTFIGGRGTDEITSMAIGPDGSIYAVGYTNSFSSFPRSSNAVQRWSGGGEDDMFLVVLDSSGSNLRYGTFIGGSGYDEAYTILLFPDGSVAIGGLTSSKNINVPSNALQSSLLGEEDGLLIILDPSLERISYCTYFGGGGQDSIERMLFSDGDLFLAGFTTSRNLPATHGVAQPEKSEPNGPNESVDSWLMRLNYSTHHIKVCTYLGGEADDNIQTMQLFNDFVILAGYTTSSRFPVTEDAEKKVKNDYFEAFLTIINDEGTKLLYSTYFVGNGGEFILSSIIDNSGIVTCVGTTTSTDLPVTPDAEQMNNAGGNDAFIAIFDFKDKITNLDARAAVSDIEFAILSCAPHPFSESGFTISYRAPARGNVVLRVCDALGRTMEQRRVEGAPGVRLEHFLMRGAPPSVYYLILEAAGARTARPVVRME